jgi:hypothetical protein
MSDRDAYATCLYCGADVPLEYDRAAPADDDQAWSDRADYHNEGCEWVHSRAHQI